MSGEWDKPVTKPMPGPAASESFQMSVEQRNAVIRAGAEDAHKMAGHLGDYRSCWCSGE